MSAPNTYQLRLLGKAVKHLEEKYILAYLDLKRLLAEKPTGYKEKFQEIFVPYYALNSGGLTKDFMTRYFDLLFGLEIQDDDPYTPFLLELYEIRRRKGDRALQSSFVSKLVAIHDESSPIFDRHVSYFFGITIPRNDSVKFRIAGFVENLKHLRKIYQCWAEDPRFRKILLKVKQKYPGLENCATSRIADFLVWTVGRKKLGSNPEAEK